MTDFQTDIRRALGQLDNMDAAIRRNLLPAARAGAEIIVDGAKSNVPVRSARLRDGIQQRDDKSTRNSAVVLVFNSMFYADAVEKGPHKRPFMRPAIDSKRNEVARKMADVVNDAVKRDMGMRS